MSLEFAVLNTAREFTSKAGGYAFDMSGVLSVKASDGLDIEIPITYTGDGLPGYNFADISLTAPSETVEYRVITSQDFSYASGEAFDTTSAYFDAETRNWIETEELLALFALTNSRVLLGSNLHETSNIAADGQMKLSGQETLDGVDTHIISGKLTGKVTKLEVTYRVGVDDALLRQIQVSGQLEPSLIGALVDGISADSVNAELTVNFSDYGKEVAYKSPFLAETRFSHDSTLLDDGRILVSGGFTGTFENDELFGFPSSSYQIYDPLTATWTFMGPTTSYDPQTSILTVTDQSDPTASGIPELAPSTPPTRLPDGRLVSVAALGGRNMNDPFSALAIFDAETDEWTRLTDVPTDRSSPGAIALNDGRVLVVGGSAIASTSLLPNSYAYPKTLDMVEAYDLDSGEWQTLEPINNATAQQTLIHMGDGRVMAVGGFTDFRSMLGTDRAEIFNPKTNTWTLTGGMNVSRISPEAIALKDGRVLATGGVFPPTDSPASETYDPATGEWTETGAMSQHRSGHTLTLLPDGRVLAVGGIGPLGDDDYIVHSDTEIFDPVTNTWSPGPELSQPRAIHSATLMPDGSVLIAGGVSERNGEKYLTLSTEPIKP